MKRWKDDSRTADMRVCRHIKNIRIKMIHGGLGLGKERLWVADYETPEPFNYM